MSSKYVDDMSVIEGLCLEDAEEAGENELTVKAGMPEYAFRKILQNAEEVNMKVNEEKTTLLCMNASRKKVTSYINNVTGRLTSSDSLKLLGFNFTEAPNVEAHVKNLVKKVHMRTWSLINLKKAQVENSDVLAIYKSIVRSVLDYASVTYNSLLTKEQEEELERLQRKCIRVIYGWDKPYTELLQEASLKTLKERREDQCIKFAENCLQHETLSLIHI